MKKIYFSTTCRSWSLKALVAMAGAVMCLSAQAQERIPNSSMWLSAGMKSATPVTYAFDGEGVETRVKWGLDTAWDDQGNVTRGTTFIGKENMGSGRISFQPSDLIGEDGELSSEQKKALTSRIGHIKMSGTKDVMLNCDHEALNAENYKGKPEEWYKVIKASVKYAQARGLNVVSISPFNEPDYTPWNEGSKDDFREIARLISEDEELKGIRISAGNTLNADYALEWYEYMKPYVTEGNTHQLAGSFDNYAGFFQKVREDGNYASADELHNVMEAMVGVEYGMQSGVWWGYDGVARGDFCRATADVENTGRRLGYAENRGAWSAASVYRLPDGRVEAFLGTSERQANTSTYEFRSTDRDVYYDGYGPTRIFTMEMPGGTGYQNGQTNAERMIRITHGEDVQPFPIEAGNYVIMNAKTRRVITVKSGNMTAGTAAVQNTYKPTQTYQQWVVEPVSDRVGGDFSYYSIKSVRNQNMNLDLLNWSLTTGGTLCIYNGDGGANEQWFFEYAGNGNFIIRSRHSGLCVEINNGSTTNDAQLRQAAYTGKEYQHWRFIPVEKAENWKLATALVAPAKPEGLKTKAFPASVYLSWTENTTDDDLSGYMILRGEKNGEETTWETIGRMIQDTHFMDNSCVQGKQYIYKVRAIDFNCNFSEASDEVEAKPTGEPSLIAQYQFDENLIDNTVGTFDAALAGSAVYSSVAALHKSGSHSLSLNGTDNYLVLPSALGNLREMTIASWVNVSNNGSWTRLFDFGNGTSQYMFLTPNNGSEMRFVLKNGGDEQILSAPRLTSGWKHVAVTLDDSGARIFLNGEEVASSSAITIRPADFQPGICYVGRSQFAGDPLLKGRIDDFRIYNYALTATEISSIMTDIANDVQRPTQASGVVATEYFNLDGTRSTQARRGISIVKERHADGSVTTRKVLR